MTGTLQKGCVYLPTSSAHPPTQARRVGCACIVALHLSYLDAFQLHSCACKHHRCNSNILQCCSLGLYEDTCIGGRHNGTNILQKAALVCAHRLLLSFFPVFFSARSAYQTSPFSALRPHPSFPPRFSNESCSAAGSPWIHQTAGLP